MATKIEASRELLIIAAMQGVISENCFEIKPGYESGRVNLNIETNILNCNGRPSQAIGYWVCETYCPLFYKSSRISFSVPE